MIPSNPLEAEKYELNKEIEKSREDIGKYEEKLVKIGEYKQKFKGSGVLGIG